MEKMKKRYIQSMSQLYPSIAAATTEIINLQAILCLPKGTEHFLTDIHGEHEAFMHVLKNGSGSVKRKIHDVFGNTMSKEDKQALATLIYYPKEKLELIVRDKEDMGDWYKVTLFRLIEICKRASSKYTRSKVRKALPKEFTYVIEELMSEKMDMVDKESYYNAIIETIIETGRAGDFIIAMSELIQRLVVDHLHILGDIYDRGPGPHLIMDRLMTYHSLDIQWGNHDVLWMGAAAGQLGCITNVIRICARYNNLDVLEEEYGINLLPLASFAMKTYKKDPCDEFLVKNCSIEDGEYRLKALIHKAISIMQFKVEGQVIEQYPDFEMEDRKLLHHIQFDTGKIEIDGVLYPMKDMNFPTINPDNPYALTPEEHEVLERLQRAFMNCARLQSHMMLLLHKGDLYKVYNNNLLYHGCVLLEDDGTLKEVTLFGKSYCGYEWYQALESYVRQGFTAKCAEERELGRDMMWYIWNNKNSPLFGKDKMTTFERYFISDKKTHVERKNAYYTLLENEEVVNRILDNFGVEKSSGHIINGHVPVKSIKGESPLKCNGKVLVIDGGFAKSYQKETGIAGYTLTYNSFGLILVAHKPFESTEAAIEKEIDIHSENIVVDRVVERKSVGDTDIGMSIKEKIQDLGMLLDAYHSGLLVEK
ncbi:MAG: fructose-1,6-bisphosphatase [Lachnospiraceae bacterium]